jgi:hypothetical protein
MSKGMAPGTRAGRKIPAWAVASVLATMLSAAPAKAPLRWVAGRRFRTGVSVVAAGSLDDGVTTQQCLRRNACMERDPVFGRYPSAASTCGEGVAFDWAIAYAVWKARPHRGAAALPAFKTVEIVDPKISIGHKR